MKVKIVDYFPTLAGAEEGVFYFNRKNKSAKLYRNGSVENYYAVLPNLGEPGSQYADSDSDGIADIREASTNDLQDIGWRPADGSTFNKPAYTNSSGTTIGAVQVGIGSLNNLQYILFNGSGSSISISAEYNGSIKRHNNDWLNFVKGQSLTINDGDYLLYNQFVDSDGDGTPDSLDAFPNDPNEDTDADGDGVGSNADIDDTNPVRGSGVDTDGDGTDDEFDGFPNDPTRDKYDQQLVWNEYSAGMSLSNSPISLSATTDSGETISYSVISGPASVNGNLLTLNSSGTITVQASAPGNNSYNPSTITRNFNITDDVTDTDGDGTPDSSDSDNTDGPLGDADGDGTPNNQDSDNNDGPLGDSDGDGVINQDDAFPNDSTKSKHDQQLTFTTFDINASNLKLSEGPWTVDAATDSGEQLTYSVANHGGDSYFTGNVLTINDLGTGTHIPLVGTVTIQISAPGNSNYNPLNFSETFNLVDDVTDTDGDGTADYYDSDNTDGPLGDIDGDGILNNQDSDDTDGPLGDQDGDGTPNNQDNDFVPPATASWLGIEPIQISGSSVPAYNQIYKHIAGRLTNWEWPLVNYVSHTYFNGSSGYVAYSNPEGGWPVYEGLTDSSVKLTFNGSHWAVGRERASNQNPWDNDTPDSNNSNDPIERRTANLSLEGYLRGPNGLGEHNPQDASPGTSWIRYSSDSNLIANESASFSITAIDTNGDGNYQNTISQPYSSNPNFYPFRTSITEIGVFSTSSSNREDNLKKNVIANVMNYNWSLFSGNSESNPYSVFDLDTESTGIIGSWFCYHPGDTADPVAGRRNHGWIGIETTDAYSKIVNQYQIWPDSQESFENRAVDPKDWTFEGSNDGTSWTVLDTQTNQSFTSTETTDNSNPILPKQIFTGNMKEYNFVNTTSYNYYRLNISANNGDPTFLAIQELKFNAFER